MASSNDMQQKFIAEALGAHNEYRKLHGAPALTVNADLCKLALDWATNIASKSKLEHSKNKYGDKALGENVSMWFETGAAHYDGYFFKKKRNIYSNLTFNQYFYC